MGYESRIYIVNKSKHPIVIDGREYAETIASFDACVYPKLSSVFENKTDCYIIADDGNTHITEDKYGDELTEAPLPDVIKFLEDEVQHGDTYRRIKPLLGLLKGFDIEQWDNLVCLHYGY